MSAPAQQPTQTTLTSADLAERLKAKRSGKGWTAKCPAHDDRRDSLSIGRGDRGDVLLKCHAGCTTDAILSAMDLRFADIMAPRPASTKPMLVAAYDYRDEHGTLLYQSVRYDPKTFKQRRPDGRGWTWTLGSVRRVLYRLPELRNHHVVYIAEGEKDADRLWSIGLPATTNAGGAGKWRDDYAEQLRESGTNSVVILPDNDDAGRRHADTVAKGCFRIGLKVKLVTLPDLPPKGDVSDYLSGHTKGDLIGIVKLTPLYEPGETTPDEAGDAAAAHEQGRRSQATVLVDLVGASGAELWHTADDEACATIRIGNHSEHHRLSSMAMRDWLGRLHYHDTGRTASSQAIADALTTLRGMARYDGREHPVFVRVARGPAAVYLDLGDATWQAVEITPDGWRVVADPTVRFRRGRYMLPLPTPVHGASVDALRELIHVADDDWSLLVGWLLGALRGNGPYPVLAFDGEHGTGKSTAVKMIRRSIDPSKAELRAEPREIRDLMVAAAGGHVIALDNMSKLQPWLSDALCRLSTGGALSTRALYTDDDEHVIEAVRPCILNGISSVITRGDLQDRAIPITMPVISEGTRRTEDELWACYGRLWPGALGALLDAVATALRDEASVRVPDLPRMADWAVWVTAGESALGHPDDSIVSAYRTRLQTAVESSLDDDALALALRKLTLPWTGTCAELLKHLTPAERPEAWPDNPRKLRGALARLAPLLRRTGLDVMLPKNARTARERQISLKPVETRGALQDTSDGQDAQLSGVSGASCAAPLVSHDDEGLF